MPIDEGVMIACRGGVVELTATITEPERETVESFAALVAARIQEHQYQAMTDPAILNPDNLAIASCFVCRDPLPMALKEALHSLGFQPVDTEASGVEDRSMFTRFQKRPRSKLDKWVAPYLRAPDVSPRLTALEQALIEDVPRGALPDTCEAACDALIDAARSALRVELTANHGGVGALERAILHERAATNGRLVLHPWAVRGVAAFVSQALLTTAPDSRWKNDEDENAPLWVQAPHGAVVRSDPEYRTVAFIARGNKELLSTYMESVLRQSLSERSS